MTLCQYYNEYVKKQGFKCWNTFVALEKGNINIPALKKYLKREYKNEKKTLTESRQEPQDVQENIGYPSKEST